MRMCMKVGLVYLFLCTQNRDQFKILRLLKSNSAFSSKFGCKDRFLSGLSENIIFV